MNSIGTVAFQTYNSPEAVLIHGRYIFEKSQFLVKIIKNQRADEITISLPYTLIFFKFHYSIIIYTSFG